MSDIFQQNKQISSELTEAERLAQEKTQSKSGSKGNAFMTENAQAFANYHQGRHDPNGHLYTADFDPMTDADRNTMAYYQARKAREANMESIGVSQKDIALFRAWDKNIVEAYKSGKGMQGDEMFSTEYAEKAWNAYQYDEAMYHKYVNFGRTLSQAEYDPDGDGHFNIVSDVLKEFKGYNDNDLADVYLKMNEDQRRMLAFDGVHSREDWVKYIRSQTKAYDDAHSGFLYDLKQFFVGMGHGVVSAVSDLIKLPTMLISAASALVTWDWDNPLSRELGKWHNTVDDALTKGYDAKAGYDKDNFWAKAGGWAGTAIEIAGEVALTGGIATVARYGTEKMAVRTIEKAALKAGEEASLKAATKWSAKSLENIAVKEARKLGTKVDEEILAHAVKRMAGKVEGEEAIKILESTVGAAARRIERRGMLHMGEKAAIKEAKKLTVKEGEKVAQKELTKAAESTGAKAIEKEKENFIKKMAKKVATGNKARAAEYKIANVWGKNTGEHISFKLMHKEGSVLARGARAVFGKTDGLTRLFALKSFAHTVQEAQARGDNPLKAMLRGVLAYGSTNFIWGKMMQGGGGNAITKMFGSSRDATKKAITEGIESKTAAILIAGGTRTLHVASAMLADGTFGSIIQEGLRRDETGKLHYGIKEAIAQNFNKEKLLETFGSALTMELTGGLTRTSIKAAKDGYGAIPIVKKQRHENTMVYINEQMSSEEAGIGSQAWDSYKRQADKALGKGEHKDREIVDKAAAMAIANGGAVGDLVTTVALKGKAHAWIKEVRENIDSIASEMDSTVRDILDRVDQQIAETTGQETGTGSAADFNFRLFVESSAMNNANLFDGQEIPADVKVNNYQPEDFAVSYAIFKKTGYSAKDVNPDTIKAISKSFKDSQKLKKELGAEVYSTLVSKTPDQIDRIITNISNPESKEEAKRFVKFTAEMQKAFKKEYKSQEAKDKAIDGIIDEHGMTMEEINFQEGLGNTDANLNAHAVEAKEAREDKQIKEAIASGNPKEFFKEWALKETRTPRETLDMLEKMRKGKRLSREEYMVALDESVKALSSISDIKEELKGKEFAKEMKLIDIHSMKEDYSNSIDRATRFLKKLPEITAEDPLSQDDAHQLEAYKNDFKKTDDKILKVRGKLDQSVFHEMWKLATGEKFDQTKFLDLKEELDSKFKKVKPKNESMKSIMGDQVLGRVSSLEDQMIKLVDIAQDLRDRKIIDSEVAAQLQKDIEEARPTDDTPEAKVESEEKFNKVAEKIEAINSVDEVVKVPETETIKEQIEEAPEPDVESEEIIEEETPEEKKEKTNEHNESKELDEAFEEIFDQEADC